MIQLKPQGNIYMNLFLINTDENDGLDCEQFEQIKKNIFWFLVFFFLALKYFKDELQKYCKEVASGDGKIIVYVIMVCDKSI